MKLVKASNGATKITLSKKEWKEIGKTAGWMKLDDGRDASGRIDLGNGYIFTWMLDKKGTEVSGQVIDSEGKTVEGTYGWYRTDDPEKAAIEAKKVVEGK